MLVYKKISDLTNLPNPASGDLIPIVDISDTTDASSGTTKKITKANLFTSPTFVGTATLNNSEDLDIIRVNNSGTGNALTINQTGVGRGFEMISSLDTGTSNFLVYTNNTTGDAGIFRNYAATGALASVFRIEQNNASGMGTVLQINNYGGGHGINIDQDGDGEGITVDNTQTNHGIRINQAGVLAVGKHGLFIESAVNQVHSDLVRFEGTGTGTNQNIQRIINAGSGNSLLITDGSSVEKFSISSVGITKVTNTTDQSSNNILILQGDRATPATNDSIYQSFKMSDSAGNQDEFGRITVLATDVTSTSEDAQMRFGIAVAGTLVNKLSLAGTALVPVTNNDLSLGTSGNQWSDLFLAEGGVINWDNGDIKLTQGGDTLAVEGGQVTFGAPTTAYTSFNLPTGTAPTSPVDGDVWREDNTNTGLKIRINGVTKTITVS